MINEILNRHWRLTLLWVILLQIHSGKTLFECFKWLKFSRRIFLTKINLRNKHTGKRPKEKKYINNINNNKIYISLLSPGYLTFPFTCVYSFSYPSLFSILDLGFVLLLQLYRSVSPSVPHFSLSLLLIFPLFCLSLCLSLVSFLSLYPFY